MDLQALGANERGMSRRTVIGRVGGGVSVAAFAVLGVGYSARPAGAQDEAIGDAWAAAWSSGDGEQVAAVFAEDGNYEDVPSETVVQGSAAIGRWAQGYFDAFSEVTQSVVRWTVIPGGAVAEWLVEGTHRETGHAVFFRGVSIFALANGKIQWETAYYDNGTFIAQTGGTCEVAVTSPDGPPAAATPQT